MGGWYGVREMTVYPLDLNYIAILSIKERALRERKARAAIEDTVEKINIYIANRNKGE